MISNKSQQNSMPRRLSRTVGARPQQRGAVLIVGLIILVVLTLLGVQAMRSNVSQERMAFNMRERNVAFQAAEAALRVGEATWTTFDGLGVNLADPTDWATGEEKASLAAFDAGLAAQPKYHIGPPQYLRIGISIPAQYRLIYPVSSLAVGSQASSVVVLQSGYEPPN